LYFRAIAFTFFNTENPLKPEYFEEKYNHNGHEGTRRKAK
jgi:hypothetical protein